MSKLNKSRKEKKEKEEKEQVEKFVTEYKELSKKHGIDISPSLNVTQQGIVPVIRFVKVDENGKPVEK